MHHRKLTRSMVRCLLSATAFAAAIGVASGATAQNKDAASAKPKAAAPANGAAKGAPAKTAAKAKAKKESGAPSAQAKAAIANAQQLMDSGKPKDIEAGIQSLGLLGTQGSGRAARACASARACRRICSIKRSRP